MSRVETRHLESSEVRIGRIFCALAKSTIRSTHCTLVVGKWDFEGEDWPLVLIYRGLQNQAVNKLHLWHYVSSEV